MRILISGASGLVGRALQKSLREAKHEVIVLQRGEARPGVATWDPARGTIDLSAAGRIDAVFHLAGDNISARRWSAKKKATILNSRVDGTNLLARSLASLASPPQLFVSASAVGIYGDRGNEGLHEGSTLGDGFLADVCQQWEQAAQPAIDGGVRVVYARFGVILDLAGGALHKMLGPFRLGLGGVLGSGQQWMSWISLADVVAIFHFLLAHQQLAGALNLVAPEAVSNCQFTKAFGRALKRPTILPMPAFLVSLLFGEMGRELLLSSAKVEPQELLRCGFHFRHESLQQLLAELT